MNSTPSFHLQPATGDIDLVELFCGVWAQKKLVAGCIILAGLLGVAYAFLAPQVYQVSSSLRPVSLNELDALNRSDVYTLPPADALNKVALQLDSYDTRLAFFRDNPTLFQAYQRSGQTLEQSFETFNRNAIRMVLPDSKSNSAQDSYIRLEMQYPKGVDGVAILNGFVAYAIARQRDQVGEDLRVIVSNRLAESLGKIDSARDNYEHDKAAKIARLLEGDTIKRAQLQDELAALRTEAELVRTHRLAELDEAIAIAKSVGIKSPTTPSAMGALAAQTATAVVRTELINQATPLYFLGTRVLEAERAALQQRTNSDFTSARITEIGKQLRLLEVNREVEILNARSNDDVFLQDIEWLRAEIARLRGLNVDMSQLKLVTIDRLAQEPWGPAEPRKALVIGLSLLAGLILGALVALMRYFVAGRDGRPSPQHRS